MLKVVLTHFAMLLSNIPDSDSPEAIDAFEKLRSSLSIIIVLVQRLESSLNIYRLLWEALYMFMAISRFTGDPSGVCCATAGYFRDKQKSSEMFVDPEWRQMLPDFERCNLDTVLGESSPDTYFLPSIVDWGRRCWWRSGIDFELMKLHPRPRPGEGGSGIIPSVEANPVAKDSARHSVYVLSYKGGAQH
jgi:hypothetical protein